MRSVRLVIHALVLVGLAACGTYHQDYSATDDGTATHGFKTLSFESVKAIVFQPYCARCHFAAGGNKGNVNLETFSATSPHIQDIRVDIQTDSMPKGSPAPSYAKVVLLAWIGALAPETSNIPLPDPNAKPPPPPPPPPPGFDSISNTILQPYCARCHTEISSYEFVVANLQKIKDDVTSNSMPKNSKLSDKMKQQLFNWISSGAPQGFGEISKKIFLPYCIRCHGYLSDIKKVEADIDQIQGNISSNKMPKDSDPLPDNLKALLTDWVKAGMPN